MTNYCSFTWDWRSSQDTVRSSAKRRSVQVRPGWLTTVSPGEDPAYRDIFALGESALTKYERESLVGKRSQKRVAGSWIYILIVYLWDLIFFIILWQKSLFFFSDFSLSCIFTRRVHGEVVALPDGPSISYCWKWILTNFPGYRKTCSLGKETSIKDYIMAYSLQWLELTVKLERSRLREPFKPVNLLEGLNLFQVGDICLVLCLISKLKTKTNRIKTKPKPSF